LIDGDEKIDGRLRACIAVLDPLFEAIAAILDLKIGGELIF